MTIYSQNVNRGKVRILATFECDAGPTSSTVTSVNDAAKAVPIVDALNRISACAALPVSVWDTRGGGIEYYPREHLALVSDRDCRAHLLDGSHSLWYEYIKKLLHHALADLDAAVSTCPEPVRMAIDAELVTEARALSSALLEFTGESHSEEQVCERAWNFGRPFVLFDGGMYELRRETREQLDWLEAGLTADQLCEAIEDLRLLYDVYVASSNHDLTLEETDLCLLDDPDPLGSDRYYLSVDAPLPDNSYRQTWEVAIGRWDVDRQSLEEEGSTTSTGEPVLHCALASRPSKAELVKLVDRSNGDEVQLAAWAGTPVGATLAGTSFVVSKRP